MSVVMVKKSSNNKEYDQFLACQFRPLRPRKNIDTEVVCEYVYTCDLRCIHSVYASAR
jgi:hypothetical protein